jgi:SnoaL-like polyketide cyclase
VSVEANERAARRFVTEALDGGNAAVLNELFLAGAVRHFPPGDLVVGSSPPQAARDRTMRTEIHHLYGKDDYVSIHLTHHVTFGPDARFNTRAGWAEVGGKSVEWNAMVVLRFEGEKIAEEWVVRDELQVLLQLGLVTPLATASDASHR